MTICLTCGTTENLIPTGKHCFCPACHAENLITRAAPRNPRRARGGDHEDCLSMGACGPDCEYASIRR